MLYPASVIVPKQLLGRPTKRRLFARMVLLRLAEPEKLMMAPPGPPPLPEKVLLVTVSVPVFSMPAPEPMGSGFALPKKVLLMTVNAPPFAMAPPSDFPTFPEKVLLVIFVVPSLAIAPRTPLGPEPNGDMALFAENVLLVTVNSPLLRMPPPASASLPEKTLLATVNVPALL